MIGRRAAAAGEPAVVLVRQVRQERGGSLDEQDLVEVQQRVGQGHSPHGPGSGDRRAPDPGGRPVAYCNHEGVWWAVYADTDESEVIARFEKCFEG